MENERLLESERLHIEHIRALDLEELQVEIVDDTVSSSDDDPLSVREDAGSELFEQLFDTSLASLHTYLGETDDTHGRLSMLDGGTILNLPTIYLEGVVLFPEATLPLRVIHHGYKAAVERALNQSDAPCVIGVVGVHRQLESSRICIGTIGTTAEIRQYKRLDDGSITVLARGQQRFYLRRHWADVEGAPCAEVQIIEEDTPVRTPKCAFAQLAAVENFQRWSTATPIVAEASPTNHHVDEDMEIDWKSDGSLQSGLSPRVSKMHESSSDSHDTTNGSCDDSASSCDDYATQEKSTVNLLPTITERSEWCQKHQEKVQHGGTSPDPSKEWTPPRRPNDLEIQDSKGHFHQPKGCYRAPLSFWPRWVYAMYDSYSLAQRAADKWREVVGSPSMEDLVKKPDLLSFYIASRLPLSQTTRQELLEINGVSYRLRREIQLLECFNLVRCKSCQTVIAKRSDMLIMSTDGPLNAYVNPQGYVHETMTFYKTNGLALHGFPVREHSWFPGYAWTITDCATCESNMGWLFTATNQNLRPKSFWAIRSCQIADDTCSSLL